MSNIKHAVVRTDNMTGTDVRSQLVSVDYYKSEDPTDIDNGNIVVLDGLLPGQREVFKGVDPTSKSPRNNIVLICSPEVCYESGKDLVDFYNEKGTHCRGYHFSAGQVFSVTKEALAGKSEPAVGDIVEVAAGTKMSVVDKMTGLTSGSTLIGNIIAVDVVGRLKYFVIKVQ